MKRIPRKHPPQLASLNYSPYDRGVDKTKHGRDSRDDIIRKMQRPCRINKKIQQIHIENAMGMPRDGRRLYLGADDKYLNSGKVTPRYYKRPEVITDIKAKTKWNKDLDRFLFYVKDKQEPY